MNMRAMLFVFFAAVLCAALSARAQTVGIQGGGTYPSIQAAVNAAADGNTIIMSTGTFFETVIVSNKDLALEGGYHTDLLSRPGGYTAIDAGGGGTALWFMDSSSRVDQVSLVHGAATAATFFVGGGCMLHRSWVEFNDASMCSNRAPWFGGGLGVGLYAYGKLVGASRIFSNSALRGGGAWVDGRLDIVDDDADVFDNTAADGDGGGIWVETGYLRLFQGDVHDNYANCGGGDLDPSGGGIGAFGSFVEMGDGTLIYSNFASWGGGIALMNCTAVLGRARNDDVWCHGNSAWRGGGLFVTNSHVTVMGMKVEGNGAGGLGTGAGGGAHVIFSQIISDTNVFEFDNNRIDGVGGGLCLESSTAELDRAIFGYSPPAGNEAQANGGGLYASNALIVIKDGRFLGNKATNSSMAGLGNGGAMGLYGSRLVMTNAGVFYTPTNAWGSVIAYNEAGVEGGAIDADNSDVHLRHVAVVNNGSGAGPIHFAGPRMLALNDTVVADNDSFNGWGAISLFNSANGWLFNCTVYSNGGFISCYGIYGDGSASVTMSHSILWGHGNGSISNGGAGATVQTSLIEGGWIGGTLNLDEDPQLYPGNYHLMFSSPCIDYGMAWGGADVDIDGEPRAGNYDLGADEWHDGDGDKLPDIVESGTGFNNGEIDMGTNPNDPETDGDNMSDGDEWLVGTDPLDPNSFLGFTRIWKDPAENFPTVQWISGTNAHLWFEWTTNALDGTWTWSVHSAPATDRTNEVITGPEDAMIFRVRAHR